MAPPSSPDPFVYEPLDPLRDCTRLLEIEPCTDTTGLDLRCQIKQVLFSDRPRYRALSYMWGDETTRFPIYLNGKWFTVAENLFRALGFLRREKFVGPFWIDAICINQDDIQEKNQQIRIMPHIYFRASAVLVWLGLYPEAEIVEESKRLGTVKRATRRVLNDCGYWKRLWIIQEIGNAASIEVCYAISLPNTGYPGGVQYSDCSLRWDAFIGEIRALAPRTNRIRARIRDRTGPLRLNDQLKRKNEGSHTLRSLLEAHHEALCKDPRDKVYGLAGLAEDCYGFPVDYAKSLFEVWADTLQFLQDGGQVKDEADFLDLAAILMNALGGPSQVMPPPGTSCSVELELRGLLPVGTMAKIGPTTDDMVGKLGVGDDWAASIHRSGRHASQQNESVIREMLQMENPNLPSLKVDALIGARNNCLVWLPKQRMKGDCADLVQKANSFNIADRRKCGIGSSHIYHLSLITPKGDRSLIGTVAGDVAEGDLFCSIPGNTTTLVLRPTPDATDDRSRRTVPGYDGHAAFVMGMVTGSDQRRSFGWEHVDSRNSLSIHISADALFNILYSGSSKPGATSGVIVDQLPSA